MNRRASCLTPLFCQSCCPHCHCAQFDWLIAQGHLQALPTSVTTILLASQWLVWNPMTVPPIRVPSAGSRKRQRPRGERFRRRGELLNAWRNPHITNLSFGYHSMDVCLPLYLTGHHHHHHLRLVHSTVVFLHPTLSFAICLCL
jgi:hypothetical protein